MLTYHPQLTSKLRSQGCHVAPCQAFITDLSKLLHRFQHDNHHIILCGDFNEALTQMRDGMSKLMSSFHLVDLTYNLVGHDNFATYHRGTTQIDYALCDTHTATAVIAGGYEPFQYRIKGDHHTITIDFHIPMLFGNDNNSLHAPALRVSTQPIANRCVNI